MHRLIAAALIAAVAGSAAAQTVSDTNGDGVFSLAEMQAVYPALTEADFTLVDANGDGAVDADELGAALEVGLIG